MLKEDDSILFKFVNETDKLDIKIWKPTNDIKIWKPIGKLFQIGWRDELLDSGVVDDKNGAINEDMEVVYESPLAKANNNISSAVEVVNSMVNAIEYAMVTVTGVVSGTTQVEVVKDILFVVDKNATVITGHALWCYGCS
ncbi:hypothetical protein K2173_028054 [Erythroxylum novogranatense]|uniref:Uncharacterized protein n=1 Tax=Erythroxylum novogranatense TaxID=1862640 RepID=A0AAV8U0T8_9ROSI|nr:hypothetical protein K2173_028054 [Erythroxylum novogranatense]